jgi:4-hydroxy-tetrahydrodipicolinate reductase
MDPVQPYRVVQWATGNIGSRALRAVVGHPALALAGLYVLSPDKVGKDAGELCGLPATGVVAGNDIDEVLALDPDCVLYMPLLPDIDEVCRLLESGANVVTTCGMFHHPGGMDPAVRERVEAACEKGSTSVHSTGSSPGFISEAVPIVLTSLQTRINRITIDEFADTSPRDSPAMLFDIMGFGKRPEEFDTATRAAYLGKSFGPSLGLMAEALGTPLDSIETGGEVAVATHDLQIAAGTVPKGTVAAQRMTVSGVRDGRTLLEFRANWFLSTDIEPAWDLRLPAGWRIVVDGDSPLDVEIKFDVPMERMAETSPNFTANRAVNAVPVVCAAAPGIRSTLDLPHIAAALG